MKHNTEEGKIHKGYIKELFATNPLNAILKE